MVAVAVAVEVPLLAQNCTLCTLSHTPLAPTPAFAGTHSRSFLSLSPLPSHMMVMIVMVVMMMMMMMSTSMTMMTLMTAATSKTKESNHFKFPLFPVTCEALET